MTRPVGSSDEPAETTMTLGVTSDGPADDIALVDPDLGEEDLLDAAAADRPLVSVVMGSQSDWATMTHCVDTLTKLRVRHEALIVSAHRTPRRLYDFAAGAEDRGIRVIVAGAGGAAHLPGMIAALTHLPVFGVPVRSRTLSGWDSLLSIVQMPAGVPVGTLAIGRAGAVNAALLATAVLSLSDLALTARLIAWRELNTAAVAERPTRT